jgi:xanthine dehydrogenase small subunit
MALSFIRRGHIIRIENFEPDETLLNYLRLTEKSRGTKEGCNEGDCGACTVVLGSPFEGGVKYKAVNACIMLLGQIHGHELITVDDLAVGGVLHPVQQAMVECHGSQCGFCTPGFVMSLFSLAQENRKIDRADVVAQIAGNLCRCTGYMPIIEAGLKACNAGNDVWTERQAKTHDMLQSIAGDMFAGNSTQFFAAPRNAEKLAEFCAEHSDATIISGATDVGLWITKKLSPQKKIIHTGRAQDFATVVDCGDHFEIGAGATHAQISDALSSIHPDLGVVMRRFGSRQVRASGTIGGNIANGSPIGDLPPALIALGATLHLRHGANLRSMKLEEFFVAYGKQNRKPGELVWRVDVPKPKAHQKFYATKISKRFDDDISALLGAFLFDLDGDIITAARIAFGGMAATPCRANHTEALLVGKSLSEATSITLTDFSPLSDVRASADYRFTVANALLQKALMQAAGHGPVGVWNA